MSQRCLSPWIPILCLLGCAGDDATAPQKSSDCPRGLDSGHVEDHTGEDTSSTETGGSGETGGTGETGGVTETGAPEDTGEEPVYFEVDQLGVFFDGAVLGGEISSWSKSGKIQQGHFVIYVADSEWTGELADEEHSCQAWFELSPATVLSETTFLTEGAWEGWTLDTSSIYFLGQMGTCENLHPAVWGESFYDYVSAYTWGLGMGPLNVDVQTLLLGRDDGTDSDGDGTTDVEEEVANMVGGYIYSTLTGVAAIYPHNYGYVYELDEDGEMKLGAGDKPTVNTEASKSRELVDGYYDMQPGSPLPF